MLLTLTAGTCLSGVGCSSDRPAPAPSALAAASSHFAAFARFERWALRSVESDVRMEGLAALRETMFAPLRRDSAVQWAEVQWERTRVLSYRTPLSDAALRFVPVEAPSLGRVHVATCETCKKQDGTARACVVIERPQEQRLGARVRMAFCEADSVVVSAPANSNAGKTRAKAARTAKKPEARVLVAK